MLILAIDTTLAACSAAVYDSTRDVVLARDWAGMERGHAEVLPSMIEGVLRVSGAGMGDIDRIGVTRGPGTFTGVRIGLAMARGLGLALARPVLGLTSLEAIARNVSSDPRRRPLVAAIDARRDEFFLQVFGPDGASDTPPRAVRRADAPACLPEDGLVAGPGADLLIELAGAQGVRAEPARGRPLPDAAAFAPCIAALLAEAAPPRPLYLRPPDAKPQPAPRLAPA